MSWCFKLPRLGGPTTGAAFLLQLLSACGTDANLVGSSGYSADPGYRNAYESPEFEAHGLEMPAESSGGGQGIAPAEKGVALIATLLGKPVFRPVTSAFQLLSLTAHTSVDAVKPVSLIWKGDGPVAPLSDRPGMDLAQWEEDLDALTGTKASSGRVRLLIDGERFFPRFVDAVMEAEESIHLRTYIFDNDDYATAMAGLFKRRSQEVEVKVLVDGLGTLVASGIHADSMPQSFKSPNSIVQYLEKDSQVSVRTRANAWFTGDHVKTFIIDREVAFLGGMNIGREYRYDWHDLMMEVRGPVVQEIDREFQQAWAHAGPFGDLGYLASYFKPRKKTPNGGGHPIRLLHTRPGEAQIYEAQLEAVRRAKSYIYIQNPYFSDDEFLIELINARRRGVDVRVILSIRGDSPVMDRSNILAANAMFRRGIRVYLYPSFSHLKAAVYDGWACLGSANLDKMSLRVNRELNLATSHKPFVERLERELFQPDFEKSMEMTAPLQEHWSYYMAEVLADQL